MSDMEKVKEIEELWITEWENNFRWFVGECLEYEHINDIKYLISSFKQQSELLDNAAKTINELSDIASEQSEHIENKDKQLEFIGKQFRTYIDDSEEYRKKKDQRIKELNKERDRAVEKLGQRILEAEQKDRRIEELTKALEKIAQHDTVGEGDENADMYANDLIGIAQEALNK